MASQTADFLVEIGCEELPPKALKTLAEAFEFLVKQGLEKQGLTFASTAYFASPRRLALRVDACLCQQPHRTQERLGPAVNAAYDAEGHPTQAALGFAKSCDQPLDSIGTKNTDKGERLCFVVEQKGQPAEVLLPAIVSDALKKLPIPKRMRWGSSAESFVRPVHWVLMLLGNQVIDAEIMGVQSSNLTYGHRFHHPEALLIAKPSDYENTLEQEGFVIPCFEKRKFLIQQGVQQQAAAIKGAALIKPALLDEVTGLVEWPVPLTCQFDPAFLECPEEALISAMEQHQKVFCVQQDSALMPYFIAVSNLESLEPSKVIQGNERVVRARLADAQFFYETDRQTPLSNRLDTLKHIIFQKRLGTLYDKSVRIAELAKHIAKQLGADQETAYQAALLCKADLATDMVGEFPDLQGTMGYYYARSEGLSLDVASAIKEHYAPRFSGDAIPSSLVGCAVALADKMDTLMGIFGIQQGPTGDKDPFGLRRAALGILHIIIKQELVLDLLDLIQTSASLYQGVLTNPQAEQEIFDFMLERLRYWNQEAGIGVPILNAVLAKRPSKPLDFQKRVAAVCDFIELAEAASLAAANKRVSNILDKQAGDGGSEAVRQELLREPAEVELAEALARKQQEVKPLYDADEYTAGLKCLADLQRPVDQFFDDVMVMSEEPELRENRIALLRQLRGLFMEVADISLLSNVR